MIKKSKVMFTVIPVVTLFFIILLVKTNGAYAQPPMKNHSLVFCWDKNPDVDPQTTARTTGYNIYYSSNPDDLSPDKFDYGKDKSTKINEQDISQPPANESTVTYTWRNVPEGDFYFVCTAHNQQGTESKPSNIVHKLVDYHAPESPKDFKLSFSITINPE